jgi:N-acetylglucosaminyldiphosphoundecaprenol N-acetyl-beta-D-mannosaminyltransferase
MSLDAVKILGINITTNSKSEILEELQKFLLQKSKSRVRHPDFHQQLVTIVTPNPEQIVYALKDPYFSDILNRADISLPDGIGVVFASRILSNSRSRSRALRLTKPIPGIEFMEILVSLAAKRRVPIALIGGRDGLAVKTLDCLSKQYPGLRNVWAEDGPEVEIENHACLAGGRELRIMNYDENLENRNGKNSASIPVTTIRKERYFERLVEQIREKKTQIIFVGLGAPKQEYFIEALQKALRDTRYVTRNTQDGKIHNDQTCHMSHVTCRPIVLMSVGGSFDEIAGVVRRAPSWVRDMNLKWLWRLILQPWRIFRQLALVQFVVLVLKKRYKKI